MASLPPPPPAMSFGDFPDDVQLNILSFLTPAELSAFACTSRRSASLCLAPDLWFAMCDRRWGSLTAVRRWAAAAPLTRLYRTLDRWDRLIGFWRRIGQGSSGGTPPLVFFEWGSSFITGSRVSPSPDPSTYAVLKVPFLWLGLSPHGDPVSYLHPGCRFESPGDFVSAGFSDSDLVPVSLSFVGSNHFVVEENGSFFPDARADSSPIPDETAGLEGTSPPDRIMSEIYQYFANRTSPGGDKASRRQRRKERERLGRRRLSESEHFVKIENDHPTPARPLQGLWKGICEGRNLNFYLAAYDDVGGITCRRVGDAVESFSGYSPVFWTSNTTFLERPFSREEEEIYSAREHIRPVASDLSIMEREVVSRILSINSSYDLVIPDLTGSSGNTRNVEGRIWEYEDGTFGFGFLRNNLIVDLKHLTLDGHLFDAVEYCFSISGL